MGTLTNSEDPNQMQHFIRFCTVLLRLKQSPGTEIHHNLEKSTCDLKVHNGQFHTYCINMHGKIHQNTKSLAKTWLVSLGRFISPKR